MNDSSEFEHSSTETITPVVESAAPSPEIQWERQEKRWRRRSFAIAALLFALTLISTLVVGASFAALATDPHALVVTAPDGSAAVWNQAGTQEIIALPGRVSLAHPLTLSRGGRFVALAKRVILTALELRCVVPA